MTITSRLKDLENSMRNHSEERLDKIKELGNELIEHECMADTILADVKAVTDRWDTLQHQVSQHILAYFSCMHVSYHTYVRIW